MGEGGLRHIQAEGVARHLAIAVNLAHDGQANRVAESVEDLGQTVFFLQLLFAGFFTNFLSDSFYHRVQNIP